MKILVHDVTIIDSLSQHNNSQKDLLIENGKIITIGNDKPAADTIVNGAGCFISPGWVDIFTDFADPGYEFRETLHTGAAAAAAGGFTQVFVTPGTRPAISGKSQVEYILNKASQLPISVKPLGSISKNIEGKELAEMYDMLQSGAVAFTDGIAPLQSAALFIKALQYIKAFQGILVQLPVDDSISKYGLINEGIVSTKLGLPGIPAVAEHIMIERDIELLRYTGGRLHITGVSTAKGILLIANARQEGLDITCSVTPYHLFFSDEDLHSYDTNLKVMPPLRNREDVHALRRATQNGIVDCITSHHLPQDVDNKICEFEYAKSGMTGLQTCYAALQTAIPQLKPEKIVDLLSNNARKIFKLPAATIKEGNDAELTIFNPSLTTTLTKEAIKSKSYNTAFLNKTLQGAVIGVITKGKLLLSNQTN